VIDEARRDQETAASRRTLKPILDCAMLASDAKTTSRAARV